GAGHGATFSLRPPRHRPDNRPTADSRHARQVRRTSPTVPGLPPDGVRVSAGRPAGPLAASDRVGDWRRESDTGAGRSRPLCWEDSLPIRPPQEGAQPPGAEQLAPGRARLLTHVSEQPAKLAPTTVGPGHSPRLLTQVSEQPGQLAPRAV